MGMLAADRIKWKPIRVNSAAIIYGERGRGTDARARASDTLSRTAHSFLSNISRIPIVGTSRSPQLEQH